MQCEVDIKNLGSSSVIHGTEKTDSILLQCWKNLCQGQLLEFVWLIVWHFCFAHVAQISMQAHAKQS